MHDLDAKKAAVRVEMRGVLAGAAETARSNVAAAALHAHVVWHPKVKAAGAVLLYAAVEAWNEFETAALAGHLLGQGKRVACPRMGGGVAGRSRVKDDPHLDARWIEDWEADFDRVRKGAAMIEMRTPRESLAVVDPRELDVAIVPGLAFDERGGRLGRGGGWYDRFLPRMRAEVVRIGAAWEAQIVPEVPMGPLDQRMDYVVTEKRVIEAARR